MYIRFGLWLSLVMFFTHCTYTTPLTKSEGLVFEECIQLYRYHTYTALIKAQQYEINRELSSKNKKCISEIQKMFEKDMDVIRRCFYHENQQKAVELFKAHLKKIMRIYTISPNPLKIGLEHISNCLKRNKPLFALRSLVNTVTSFYYSLLPKPSLSRILSDNFLCTFFSTKVVPQCLITAGVIGSLYWMYSLAGKVYRKEIPNPFKEYNEIKHEPKCSIDDVLCSHTKCRHFVSDRLSAEYMTHNYRSDGCQDPSKKCLRCTGFKPLHLIGLSLLAHLYTMTPFALSLFFAKIIEEAQLPHYLHRIKNQEALLKKIEVDANLPTEYEKTIGFDMLFDDQTFTGELYKIVDFLKHPFKYPTKNGITSLLLSGPPGTGKSLMIKTLAKESGSPIITISADALLNKQAKEKLTSAWNKIEEIAIKQPQKSAILLIEGIDYLGNRAFESLNPLQASSLASLITMLEQTQRRNPALHIAIIMTAHYEQNIDLALLRPGRIDRKVTLNYPNEKQRHTFFERLLPPNSLNLVEKLTKETKGFSGAMITALIEKSAHHAAYKNRKEPIESDYLHILQEIAESATPIAKSPPFG